MSDQTHFLNIIRRIASSMLFGILVGDSRIIILQTSLRIQFNLGLVSLLKVKMYRTLYYYHFLFEIYEEFSQTSLCRQKFS